MLGSIVRSEEEEFEVYALFDRKSEEVLVDVGDVGEKRGCGVFCIMVFIGGLWMAGWSEHSCTFTLWM